MRRSLGDSLLAAGLVTREQLDQAIALQASAGHKLGQALVSLGFIDQSALLRIQCADAGIPFVDKLEPAPEAAALVSLQVARQHAVVPLEIESRHLVLAMANPFDLLSIRALTRAAGRSVRVVGAPREAVTRAIDEAYGVSAVVAVGGAPAGVAVPPRRAERTEGPRLELARADQEPPRDEASENAAAVVSDIVDHAIALGATDIHIEPFEREVRVRYRVDGLLTGASSVPAEDQAPLVRRVKTMAGLDAEPSRLPRDGRARVSSGGRDIDLRVSTFPTLHGEDIVLRVLDRDRVTFQLEKIGIDSDDVLLLRSALQRSHGLVPVAGPTGSGKTMTLYAALSELNTGERAIVTLEDPIEFALSHVMQSQVEPGGLNFADALRALLKHDPDVILVGAIRDAETAQIALTAALTGHLVLTTLHTTTAASTIPRLLDMGVAPYVIASAVTMFVSQRLVRLLCPSCKTRIDTPAAVRMRFELEGATLYGPKGCPECRATGYRGRTGIFELLPMSPDIATAIYARTPPDQIHRDSGRPTLLQDGLRKVRAGYTTLDEVLRVTA